MQRHCLQAEFTASYAQKRRPFVLSDKSRPHDWEEGRRDWNLAIT